jgi:uncharacterized LabA/DUF88 family protein
VVKFFGRTAKTAAPRKTESKEPVATKTATTSSSTRTSPTTSTRIAPTASRSTSTTNGAKPATTTRRARPPRKDWAAEAADTPAGTPSPRPSSLATAPAPTEDGAGATTKRRRGTRGGRGRKRASTSTTTAAEVADLEEPATTTSPKIRDLRQPKAPAGPLTLEDAIAQQAQALQRFTVEMTANVQRLQNAIEDLGDRVERGGATTTATPRVAIFVDVPNLIYAAERRKVNLDFGKILEYFTRGRELVRASAYAPITDDPQAKLENQRFVQSFVGHPYRIITKPLKRFADGSMKANFDIELAIDILTMSDRLDVVVLMSGDGDFRRVVELIGSRGVRVEVVAFAETAAHELKSVADLYVDLGQHIDKFKSTR